MTTAIKTGATKGVPILAETVISLAQAARELNPVLGHTPCTSTVYRWCTVGSGGVRLEFARVGSRILTSHEALSRFIQRRTEATV